jgi:CubicO group peptidase (beta-lactamase class C family)
MRSGDWARLGYLMLHGGNWNGTQLISPAYVREAVGRVDVNHGYGLLFWLNGGDSAVLPNVYGPDGVSGSLWKAAPPDMFGFVGMRNQRIFVVPSLDMVIVRLGDPGEYELDTRNSVWQSQAGVIDYELVRLIMQSVTDVDVPDPGPYRGDGLGAPPTNAGLVQNLTELNDVLAGLGVPFWAPQGCTPAGCN